MTKEAVDFVREMLESALWDAAYHQFQLPLARANMAMSRDLLERAGLVPTDLGDDEGDEPDEFENIEEMASYIFGNYRWTADHHESSILRAHKKLAVIKLIIARCGFEIDIAECEAAAQERLRKRFSDS